VTPLSLSPFAHHPSSLTSLTLSSFSPHSLRSDCALSPAQIFTRSLRAFCQLLTACPYASVIGITVRWAGGPVLPIHGVLALLLSTKRFTRIYVQTDQRHNPHQGVNKTCYKLLHGEAPGRLQSAIGIRDRPQFAPGRRAAAAHKDEAYGHYIPCSGLSQE
jgi:hypothetical protein